MPQGRGRVISQKATMYRDLDAANGNNDETYLDDARFDAITEKVIAYMDATDPSEWSNNQWGLFRALWMDRKSKRKLTEQEQTTLLSTEELERLMSSGDR